MWPDRVLILGPLALESDGLLTVLHGPARIIFVILDDNDLLYPGIENEPSSVSSLLYFFIFLYLHFFHQRYHYNGIRLKLHI